MKYKPFYFYSKRKLTIKFIVSFHKGIGSILLCELTIERGSFYKKYFRRLYFFLEKRNYVLVRMSFYIIDSLFENFKCIDDEFGVLSVVFDDF